MISAYGEMTFRPKGDIAEPMLDTIGLTGIIFCERLADHIYTVLHRQNVLISYKVTDQLRQTP